MTINYLGLGVVKVTMTNENKQIEVKAEATPLATIAANMDNTYISEYEGEYLSINRSKKINQKDYWEDREIVYDHKKYRAQRISNLNPEKNKSYFIEPETRDFFTALYYIRYNLQSPKELYLDANSLMWSCRYAIVDQEEIDTFEGRQETYKVEIWFSKLSQEKQERSDMLTNNIVREDKPVYIWFTKDTRHLPVKTRYSRRPFPVYWELDSYSE